MEGKAPGLKIMRRPNAARKAYWVARADLVKRGYTPKTVPLPYDPDNEIDRADMAGHCRRLWSQMLEWAEDPSNATGRRGYDGTLGSLIDVYQTHELSPFREIKWNSREMYARNLAILQESVGSRRLDNVEGLDFRRWYDRLKEPAEEGSNERLTRAHSCITILRAVLTFGQILGIADATRLRAALHVMQFKRHEPRTETLTFAMVEKFLDHAKKSGLRSVGLATLIQFELMLRQKDVIGEWIPVEGGPRRWSTGLTWDMIDSSWNLSKKTSKRGHVVEFNLSGYPLLLAELQATPRDRRIGPVIIYEATGKPYTGHLFPKHWRDIATAAGIPASVRNMDARAGAITEAREAGAEAADVAKHATHADLRMQARYNRGSLKQTGRVALLRVAARDENKPE